MTVGPINYEFKNLGTLRLESGKEKHTERDTNERSVRRGLLIGAFVICCVNNKKAIE
jgi:hypothetical protein